MARRRSRRCKYGKLKHPKGRRICKLRPARRRYSPKAVRSRAIAAEKAAEAAYIAKLKSGLGRYRRRRR